MRAISDIVSTIARLIHRDGRLDASTESYRGRPIAVTPIHGIGWSSRVASTIEVPGPFRARLVRFWTYRGQRLGGIARIEQPEHSFDNQWLTFSIRHSGSFDFDTRIADYSVSISPTEPALTEEGWPRFSAGLDEAQGFATIRADQRGALP